MSDGGVVVQDEQVKKYLGNLGKKFGRVAKRDKQYIGILSVIVLRDVIDHFERQQGPDGPWKPWSKRYREKMIKLGKGGNMILQDTGRLKGGWQPSNVRGSREGILWFNRVSYARGHDQGNKARGLPARPFAWLSAKAMGEIEKQTLRYLESQK